MKYIDEYRRKELIDSIAGELNRICKKKAVFMEVCGGHTMAIRRFGLTSFLPAGIRLISGPGCPVCVSGQSFIDKAIAFSRLPGTIITTYGDLIRVPGSTSSLEKEKAGGADVRMVYSTLDALRIARENRSKQVIFPGIGFETTAPATAAAIRQASGEHVDNFYVLSAHKVMPPALKALVTNGAGINGFIAPGHVSAITGTGMYQFLPWEYGLGVVVSGFEPVDLMQAVLMLVRQHEGNTAKVEVQYRRVVNQEGNPKALQIMSEVFEPGDDDWRGLGIIPGSGLKIRSAYAAFDAEVQIPVKVPVSKEPEGCICGLILRGLKTPPDCRHFALTCTPAEPVGTCMVSSEGTCATYYKYRE